jgi:threonine/homoserine/homoserine lactone efflux protein
VSLTAALVAYIAAAALLTVTPGLDTAMILRTAAAEGQRRAALAALGILTGCLAWGLAAALGLGVVLAASRTLYTVIRWLGAGYLVWLGVNLIARPRARFDLTATSASGGNWWLRGLLTNLLNPKVGVFYVSFLPQFVPHGYSPAPFIVLLTLIHVVMGLGWSGVLIAATTPLKRWLQRGAVVRWLDRLTGGVFIGFGLRLVLEPN